jgi:hypothetical protein
MLAQHGWLVKDGYIMFVHPTSKANASGTDESSGKLISNALVYAKELERIV